jgi:uncharacterized protein (TIGR03435 family)
MTKTVCVLFVAAAAYAQTVKPRREFEVASVKAAPAYEATSGSRLQVGLRMDGAQAHFTYFALRDYIMMAYNLKVHDLIAPDWMGGARFNIDAKLPDGASRADVPEMMQALLEQRFQLKLHRESRETQVYALVVAKNGAKLKEAPPDETDGSDPAKGATNVEASGGPQGLTMKQGNSTFIFGNSKFEATKVQMGLFADALSRFVDRPVVDMTELKGKYDFVVQFTPEDYRAMLIRSGVSAGISMPPDVLKLLEGVNDDSLFSALQSVGLKLEKRKTPVQLMIVDSASRTPVEN